MIDETFIKTFNTKTQKFEKVGFQFRSGDKDINVVRARQHAAISKTLSTNSKIRYFDIHNER